MHETVAKLPELLRAVADPLRLRMLNLLVVEELSVSELVRILDVPQPTASRHLKLLKQQGLVTDRPVGTQVFYSSRIAETADNEVSAALARMMTEDQLVPADRVALERVRALRDTSESTFFDRIGLEWDVLREQCFGRHFHLEAFIGLLPKNWVVADLGTGTGYLLPTLSRHFEQVIAVDSSESMLSIARRTLGSPQPDNVSLRLGTVEQLPLDDHQVDLALCLLTLHHVQNLQSTLLEIRRVLRPQGRLLLVDFMPHENETFMKRMADKRAGIDRNYLAALLSEAGFRDIEPFGLEQPIGPHAELGALPVLYGLRAQVME